MAPWKSPRCSPSCWDEIKQHDAEHAKLVMALAHMTRDRDEWKHQHENLLAIYQASHLPGITSASEEDASEIERLRAKARSYRETLERIVRNRDNKNWRKPEIIQEAEFALSFDKEKAE